MKLIGRPATDGHRLRTVTEAVAELEIGAMALGDLAHAWQRSPPRPEAINGAEASLDGMRRLVAELRMILAPPGEDV